MQPMPAHAQFRTSHSSALHGRSLLGGFLGAVLGGLGAAVIIGGPLMLIGMSTEISALYIASDYKKVFANPQPGTVEKWIVKNSSGGWFHPVHIHLVDFRVLRRNGGAPYPWEASGGKDVVYVGEKQGSILKDVWVWKLDASGREREGIHAQSGRIEYDSAANEFVLTPIGVTVEDRDEKAPEDFRQAPVVASSERFAPIRIPLARFFGHQTGVHIKQEWLTYPELQQARARAAAAPLPADADQAKLARRDRMKLEMVYHDKINTALAVFSLAPVGVPLGIKVSRRETSANFAVAVGLTLGYYLLTVSVKVLDRHPEYRPDLLLWAPNLILIGVGIWLFARIERR